MSGVEERLNYLEETKTKLKDSINSLGGTIEDSTPFDEYYQQIQKIIDTTIIPQSTLVDLIEYTNILNG